MKKSGMFVILMVVFAILLWISGYYGERVKDYNTSMSLRYHSGGMSAEQIDQLYEESTDALNKKDIQLPAITGWNKKTDVKLTNKPFGSVDLVTLTEVWGDMSQVIPGTLLYGTYATQVDPLGCVITKATAEKLFRTSQAVGNEIEYEGNTYQVRGVIRGEESVMLIQRKGKDLYFPFLEFQYQSGDYPASNTKEYLAAKGLSDYDGFLEGNFYGGVAGILTALPFFTLAACFFRAALCMIKKKENSIFRNILYLLAVIIWGIAMMLIIRQHVSFSEDYIPSAVSDLDFWVTKFKTVVADVRSIMDYQTWWKEANLFTGLRICAYATMGCCALIIGGMKAIKIK